MRSLALVVLVCGCMTPVMKFGEGKSRKEAQHDVLVEHLPARLAIDGDWKLAVRDVTIRVYADSDYRAQNIKWQQTFEQQLDYANAVLSSHFGIRMSPAYKTWERHAAEVPVDESLNALMKLDSGTDVFAVVGLASSLSLVESTFERIGVARLGGRHLLVRGFANLEERRAFAAAFPDLTVDERENAHEMRKRHKNATVLLHELAHMLGVSHEDEPDSLMSPTYSSKASDFSTRAAGIILYSLDQRLSRPRSPGAVEPGSVVASTSETGDATHERVVIQIGESGDATLEAIAMDLDELATSFKMLAGRDSLTEIVIQRHRKAPANALEKVMELAKQAGLSKLVISIY